MANEASPTPLLSTKLSKDDIELMALHMQARDDSGMVVAMYGLLPSEDLRTRRNAAWMLCKASQCGNTWLQSKQKQLMDMAMQTTDATMRRLLLSVLANQAFEAENACATFIDFCLYHMTLASESIAVKALCMRLAFKQCRHFPDLTGELQRTLATMEPYLLQPALQAARRNVLKDIAKLTQTKP